MNDDFLPVVREVLRECLSVAPMKGARLKPLVATEFERRTKVSFAQAFWHFPKFSDLLKAVDDLVEVERNPISPSDVFVRLRFETAQVRPLAKISASILPSQPYIQPSLWHAFTNPDTERRRFYHRRTGDVVHYVTGNAAADPIVARVEGDPDFVEISPIPRSDHTAWMKEFIDTHTLPESTRAAVAGLASVQYTSQLNRAFMASLADYAEGWRRFRTARVLERVHKWASENNVFVPQLVRSPSVRVAARTDSSLGNIEPVVPAGTPSTTVPATMNKRKALHALIDALDDADLVHVLLPATLLAKLTRLQ